MRTSPTKTLAALRQLALMEQGAVAAPEAGRLLRELVGVDAAKLTWLDAKCRSIDAACFTDIPAAAVRDCTENFHNRADGEGVCGHTIRSALAGNARVLAGPCREHVTKAYLHSEFYNRVLVPVGYGWNRLLPLRRDDGSPLGILHLGREIGSPDFSSAEVHLLEQAQHWFEHLLNRDVIGGGGLHLDSGESATLVLDSSGKVRSASHRALELLHQAAGLPFAGAYLKHASEGRVDNVLKRLAAATHAAVNGRSRLPPTACIDSRWGRFHLRSYVLSGFRQRGPAEICLHIERHVPFRIRLFRSRRFLGLPMREREVVLHMLAGRSHTEIATEMGIKPSTVIYFTRQLYRRLDINRQAELLPALLADDDAPQARVTSAAAPRG